MYFDSSTLRKRPGSRVTLIDGAQRSHCHAPAPMPSS